MNPIEKINNDKRLTSLLEGLRAQWGMGDEFLTIILWHTDDYELSNEVISKYMSTDEILLEEVLFECLSKEQFKELCLESEFLNHSKCKELYKKYE